MIRALKLILTTGAFCLATTASHAWGPPRNIISCQARPITVNEPTTRAECEQNGLSMGCSERRIRTFCDSKFPKR
jgi:hypothetical protein